MKISRIKIDEEYMHLYPYLNNNIQVLYETKNNKYIVCLDEENNLVKYNLINYSHILKKDKLFIPIIVDIGYELPKIRFDYIIPKEIEFSIDHYLFLSMHTSVFGNYNIIYEKEIKRNDDFALIRCIISKAE